MINLGTLLKKLINKIKQINALLNNVVVQELLWENPAETADNFISQTVKNTSAGATSAWTSDSDFTQYFIEYSNGVGSSNPYSGVCLVPTDYTPSSNKLGYGMFSVMTGFSIPYVVGRNISATTATSITFGQGYQQGGTAGNAVVNSRCIPVRIYGIKHLKT